MKPAYLISLDPDEGYGNPEGMREYARAVREIVESFGGAFLAPYRETRTLEGDWDPEHITLLQFPSMDRLMAFYESEQYRPWRELRQRAGDGKLVVVEGTAPRVNGGA